MTGMTANEPSKRRDDVNGENGDRDARASEGRNTTVAEMEPKLLSDLHMVAGELGIKNFRKYSKQDLIMKILNRHSHMPQVCFP